MARLKVGTQEFQDAFGKVLSDVEEFTSRMPTHQQLQNAWCDPSLRVALGLDSAESILGRKTQDIQHGAQAIFFDMAADLGTVAGKLVSFPTEALSGLKGLMNSSPVAGVLADADVATIFNGEPAEKGAAVANIALGVGLVAVGTAIPVVGQVGAFVVAIGRSIFNVLQAQKKMLEKQKEEIREKLWQSFPDLQTADSATDAGQVQYGVRPILMTDDWTPIALPRFRGDWVGIERKKGFAFAPGVPTQWSDDFGGDTQAFKPDKGMGLIPGTNVLTSVLQVNLDPRGAAVQNFLKTGMYDPRGAAYPPQNPFNGARYVIDTGTFYEATRNMCILAWEQGQVKGSPLMYRWNVPLMHERWREYCEGGIDFIKQRVFPWWETWGKYKYEEKLADLNLEGFYGSAVFYAIGSWACYLTGGTNFHPTFTKFDLPSGYEGRSAMQTNGMYPDSIYSGAFLPIKNPDNFWERCMGNIYSRTPNIKKTLDDFQAMQRWCLRHTLVCAYVRETDAAFKDTTLLDLLRKMRSALLTSQSRFAVNMLDVPEDEMHNGKDWRDSLLKSGVPKVPNKMQGGLKRVAVDPDDKDPEPERPPLAAGDLVPPAWDPPDQAPSRPTARRWWPLLAGGAGLTLAGGWAWSNRSRLKKP